jgi:hypothetical protein
MTSRRIRECTIETADAEINQKTPQPLTHAELEHVLRKLEEDEKLFIADGCIHRV